MAITAADILEKYAPQGEPIDDVRVEQYWENECTTIHLPDGSGWVVSGSDFEPFDEPLVRCRAEQGRVISFDGEILTVRWDDGECSLEQASTLDLV